MRLLLLIVALLLPAAAQAASDVSLASKVLVERQKTDDQGNTVTMLEEPGVVTPGDSLVFRLSYRNQGAQPASGFVLTNPVPASVTFVSTADRDAIFSVDGGKTWGPLALLKVVADDGTSRPATARDVTHIRWAFSHAIPAGSGGELSFRGTVK